MTNLSNNEEVLCLINVRKINKIPSVIAEAAIGFILGGGQGMVTSSLLGCKKYDFKLMLTNNNIYIEKVFEKWEFKPEDGCIDTILIKNIKNIEVTNKKSEEFVTITMNDDKIIIFARDNQDEDNIAKKLENIILQTK